MDFPNQPPSTSGFRAPPAIPSAASTAFRLSSPIRRSPAKSHSTCSSGASSAVTNAAQLSRHNSPDSVLRAHNFDLLVRSVGPKSPSATADILDLYSETASSIMNEPQNSQGLDGRAEIEDLLTGRVPGTPSGLEACVGGSGVHHQPRYVDTDPGLWWPEVANVSSSRASPASYFSSFQAVGGGAGGGHDSSNCGGDGPLNSPSAPFSKGIPNTGPQLRKRSAGCDVATSTDTGKSDLSSQKQAQSRSSNNNAIGAEPSTSGDSRPGLTLQQPLAPAGTSRTDNGGLATTPSVVPSSFGLQRLSNLSQNHYYWSSSRPNISSPTSSPVQYRHNSSRNLPHSPFSVAAPGSGLPGSTVFQPVIDPGRQSSVSTTEISSGNPPVTLATRWESLSRNSGSILQPAQHPNKQNQQNTILHHRNPTRAAHRKHHHSVTDAMANNTMSSAPSSSAHMAQTSLAQSSPILTAQNSGGLSDDDTPNIAIEYDDGENYFAYCFDRGNGRYTRLIPADVLPPLMDIPAVEHSCAGMRVLPIPRNLAPTGRSINMQPVDFATSRIDNIVATQPQPMPPTTPKRLKIYCDKWVHEGVCAFTQQGCKYKHEMPFDRETQKSLGLFHGLPSWWRKHHSELQRQIEASDASPTDQQALVVGSRSLNAGGEDAIYLGGGADGYGGHVQTPLAGRRQHHSSDLSWRRQEAIPMASTVEMTSPPTPPSSGSRANKTFTMPEHTDSSTSHSQRQFSNSGRGAVLPGFGGHVTPYMTAGRGMPVGRGGDRSSGWGAVGTPVPTGFQLPTGSATRSGTQNRPERRGSNKFASMNMFDQLSLDNPQDSPDDGDDSGEGAQLA
ncbi:hypothetical protein MCOR27_005427 [Pyricularia oryzae]|uniref:C3H1-type domain-containing protein n=2 Tax=Pyricularia TaxID=48558 RepID=A0ABQ8N7Y2_PYRGI|nr:hypothetical protein MCOR02_006031 [Pyricularia oryzae]KAI6292729.1 hypothetical protein MCOR33_009645 [Pyricularia grisea]KAI6260605.1 hypothetical protein MCOR19_003074 [Pyricularia oryzae]KAI6278884.1 hypothetical protein MCOR27_005427 [Pyricularia oryzae]KAI6279017.1 hypothetical protein MCOR26_004393 [Pyricularia oryzae]